MTAVGDVWRSPCGKMELRCGRWQDVLADVQVDAVITDPPYGARTHGGQRHARRKSGSGKWCTTRALGYDHLALEDVSEMVEHWHARCAGWIAAHTSHDLAPAYLAAAEACGRYSYAPLACVQRGMNVRLAGDGPSNWTTWLMVSRPRSMRAWGTLPGAYVGTPYDPGENTAMAAVRGNVPGAKPVWLMRATVRDYSRHGALVCDPYAGGGTTLLAAAQEGRRAIGAECDPATYELAVKRLSRGYTPSLLERSEQARSEQTQMFGAGRGPNDA